MRYDLTPLRGLAVRDTIAQRAARLPWAGMWRYSLVLPDAEPVTLGEGWTPMLRSRRFRNVFLKEEGANPTSTFKARGLALAVTMARHYGLKKLAVPSAGNAAGALAAYAAAAGIEAHIFMPKDVPLANIVEATVYGAKVTLVDGLISDCGRMVAERKRKKAGSIFPRSKNRSAWKVKKPWATNWSSSLAGSIPTRFFIRPAAESD